MPSLELRPSPEESDVFFLAGEFDFSCRETFESWLPTLTAGPGPVVLDLAHVTFMDSTGLHCILRLAHACDVVLRSPRPNVRRVIELVGLGSRREVRIEE